MGYSERCPPPISMQIKSSPSPLVLSMSVPNNFKHPNLLLRCTCTFMGYKLLKILFIARKKPGLSGF